MCVVEADAGRLGPKDSSRGESFFVTWSPKIYHEASDGAPILKKQELEEVRSAILSNAERELIDRAKRDEELNKIEDEAWIYEIIHIIQNEFDEIYLIYILFRIN